VSVILYVAHRDLSDLDITVSGIKGKVKKNIVN
jgi:hypothetical protein